MPKFRVFKAVPSGGTIGKMQSRVVEVPKGIVPAFSQPVDEKTPLTDDFTDYSDPDLVDAHAEPAQAEETK